MRPGCRVRIEKDQRETATGELRTDDPLSEFKDQILDREADPDTARQIYERLKIGITLTVSRRSVITE